MLTVSPASRKFRPATRAVHAGRLRSPLGEMSEAMFLTASFAYPTLEASEARFDGSDPGFVYSRYSNPTVAMFEARMADLEGAEAARGTASGMAAVNATLMSLLKAGDRVAAARQMFGSCRYIIEEVLPRFGVETALVDAPDIEGWRQAVTPGTKVVLLESPANPTLDVVDLEAVAAIAHQAGATFVVDNALASPVVQSPLAHGADVVVYSATKHIDGQGRCLGGVVLGRADFIEKDLATYLKHTGPAMSPFNAWVLLKSLETLNLRVERMASTAARLADLLAAHPKIEAVRYPGRPDHPQAALARRQMRSGGTMLCFDVADGKRGAYAFGNALEVVTLSNNLGDAKSILTHPATTTHQRFTPEQRKVAGIGDGLLRLSVGLEDPQDLEEDILAALEQVDAGLISAS